MRLTIVKPMLTAIIVVQTYINMVFSPMRDKFRISFRLTTPKMSDTSTNGTAISLRRRIKMAPNGATQLCTNPSQCKAIAKKPKPKPSPIPSKILA